jgi:FKBP-type peptidyl-prolyl cis-trans isomerase FkpA
MSRTPFLASLVALSALSLVALPAAAPREEPPFTKLPSGLEIQDLRVGEGAEAVSGATVGVHYTGWLADGKQFDSSRDRGKPLSFRLGAGMVIRGWDEGIAGMKVGGLRRLRIPPELAYGERGSPGTVPSQATILTEIELVAVR